VIRRKYLSIPLLVVALALAVFLAVRDYLPFSRPEPTRETTTLDFYQATGIGQTELTEYLETVSREDGITQFPVLMLLYDSQGNILANDRVTVRWDAGEYRLLIGTSGVLRFAIDAHCLPELRLIVPKGYETIRQQTIPLGTAFQPEEELQVSDWSLPIVYDGEITSNLASQLVRIRDRNAVIPYLDFQNQLRRRRVAAPVRLTAADVERTESTPAEIYRLRKDAVVVIGQLDRDGTLNTAGGVIIGPQGVVATAFHVLNKGPDIVARGVRTADGIVHPVQEVLAASQAADVAVVRIEAEDLQAAPLSKGDPVGTPVTMISHPAGKYFSLTQGHISRYSAVVLFGRPAIAMSVTTEFADGASGGPVFNARGEVSGIVSSTNAVSNQMVLRNAAPSRAILELLSTEPARNQAVETKPSES
jgi:S1-C subfamily serine protease